MQQQNSFREHTSERSLSTCPSTSSQQSWCTGRALSEKPLSELESCDMMPGSLPQLSVVCLLRLHSSSPVSILMYASQCPACMIMRTRCAVPRKALLETGGREIWAKVLKGALRSSAFLSMYCTLCWRGACVGFQATKSCSPPVIAASCWTGGFMSGRHPQTLFAWVHRPPGYTVRN